MHLQIETGFFWQNATRNDRSVKTYSFPTTLRFGIINGLEVRLRSDVIAIQAREGEDTDVGATDTVFGFRTRLLSGHGYVPTLAFQFELGIPSGSEAFSAQAVVPEFQFNAAFNLPAGLWLGLNTDFDATNDTSNDQSYWRWGAAAQLGFRPVAFDKIAVYVDIFSKMALDGDHSATDLLFLSGGLTYLLSLNAQVDVWAQGGPTDASSDFPLGAGFAYRL